MKTALKVVSFLFHPIFLPLAASILYFLISPRFFPEPIIKAKLLAVAIITIFIPVVFFYLLKTLGLAKTIFLEEAKERILPLSLYIVLLYFIILKLIFDSSNFQELHFFFVGVLFSSLTGLIMALFKLKISLHMVGIAGLTMFIVVLSIHFKINLLPIIALLLAANGLVGTARLHAKAHSGTELLLGFFIGFFPQLILLKYWL